MVPLLLISFLFESVQSMGSSQCLPPAVIEPCKCSIFLSMLVIKCNNVDDNQLVKINSHFTQNLTIATYKITDSTLINITKGMFNNLNMLILEIENSQVELFDLFYGFNGMEKVLDGLVLKNVTVSNWNISSGREFEELRLFEVKMAKGNEIPIDNIVHILPNGLYDILFENFNVTNMDQLSFQRFWNLKILSLRSGGLTNINRTFLPHPAVRLEALDLSHNPIRDLPDDMFIGMPSLEELYLCGTLLTTLHYHIFKPIYSQLVIFDCSDALNCDCDASWLLMENSPLQEDYKCTSPPSLDKRTLASLVPIELCFNCEEIQIREDKTTRVPTETYTTDSPLENNTKEVQLDTDEMHYTTTLGISTSDIPTLDSQNTTV